MHQTIFAKNVYDYVYDYNHKHHRVKFNTKTEDVDIQLKKSIDSSPAMEQFKLLQMQANKELQQFESLK